jgi:alcohol dehydrogenase YqhD (iron-dependent ADH family)
MENFTFKNTTAMIFGKGTLEKTGKETCKYGKKVLLVYGEGFIKRTGILERVIESLKKEGADIVEFPGTMPNPVLAHVQRGIELCKKNEIDVILAVGGGSVIDVAKAIGVGALYDGDVWDFFDMKAFAAGTIPVGVVLTVPGTGAESSNSSVITNEKTMVKRGLGDEIIRPEFAIMDPELAYSLSSYQTGCGVADAMSHIMERYFTPTKNVDCTDRMCEALFQSLICNGPIALAEPMNYDARAEILLASKFGHDNTVGVGRIGDFSTHKIAHQLSVFYGMAHGASVAVMFPAWMDYVYKHDLSRFVQYAVRVWNVDDTPEEPEKTALEGIRRTRKFFNELGLSTSLAEAGIPADRFAEMAEKAANQAGGIIGNFAKLNKEDVTNIYKLAL